MTDADDAGWRFADPRRVAVVTTRAIVVEKRPILRVSHDDDDGGWQFHTGDLVRIADAMVLALEEIVDLDPSVEELADLPLGWIATRASASSPWVRSKKLEEEAPEDDRAR